MKQKPKWLDDFNKALKMIEPDNDKRQKIIKLFNIVLKEKRKIWDSKQKPPNQKSLL